MSSDYPTMTQMLESVRPQGPQSTPPVQEPEEAAAVSTGRNESAATSGQLLPPDKTDEANDAEEVTSAVSKISDFVQNFQRDLQFSVDKASGRTVIKVVDSETEQVIRQIPSQETLRIAEHLDSPDSLMLSEQA